MERLDKQARAVKALDDYHFSGFHASHIGAIKSCLDYYNVDCSPSWVFGMTGHAFLMVVDEKMTDPNVGLPEEAFFTLAHNLGLDIQGFHTIASGGSFRQLQLEAWNLTRQAIDQGYPVFAKELDLGNETSIIYAYGDEGYFTHSWHGGTGHDGADNEIPWTMLGKNYCPCEVCREKPPGPSTAVYAGARKDDREEGLISLHWAKLADPASGARAFKDALNLVLTFNQTNEYQWGNGVFYSGIRAYEHWIHVVQSGRISGFYMGYYADIWHESRHHAAMFLQEAQVRMEGLAEEIARPLELYRSIKEAYKSLNELFPWMQPNSPIEDPFRRKEAVQLLTHIMELEKEALNALRQLYQRIE